MSFCVLLHTVKIERKSFFIVPAVAFISDLVVFPVDFEDIVSS